MILRAWRTRKNMRLDAAARYIGMSIGALSDIERGVNFPSVETIARIEGATAGAVQIADHWAVWRKAHPAEFASLRAEGRAAAKAWIPPAKKPKQKRRA